MNTRPDEIGFDRGEDNFIGGLSKQLVATRVGARGVAETPLIALRGKVIKR